MSDKLVAQFEDGTELDLSTTRDARAAALFASYEEGDTLHMPQRIFETSDGETVSHEVIGVCRCGTVLFSTDPYNTEGAYITGCGACTPEGSDVWESFSDED